MAPADVVVAELSGIGGYVVPANLNARGQVVIGGERQRTIRVNLDFERMVAFGITVQDITEAFRKGVTLDHPRAGVDQGYLERGAAAVDDEDAVGGCHLAIV